MIVDTVFNHLMRPVFVKPPEEVRRRLQYGYPDDWSKVCVGETQQIVTITEYLYAEKYASVLGTLKELMTKKDLAMYQRSPERFDILLERTARRLIERIQEK